MNLDTKLQRAAIIGAAGKMGRGIALLLLRAIGESEGRLFSSAGSGRYRLTLVDIDREELFALRRALKSQLVSYAEKNIIALRGYFSHHPQLISNSEVIAYFVEGCIDCIDLANHVEEVDRAELIFEAVAEDIELKTALLRKLDSQSKVPDKPLFFTNTSSIPISLLNDNGNLEGRIIGFHFYNPPELQKLIEIIPLKSGDPRLLSLANELAARLKKIAVTASDVAGFIGNGHFVREISYSCALVKELQVRGYSCEESIYLVDRVTNEWLLRPMGIFQLIDYVGLDVIINVCKIVESYCADFNSQIELIEQLIALGKCGGQYGDGAQKEGFFCYDRHQIKAIFDRGRKEYLSIDQWQSMVRCSNMLKAHPPEEYQWRPLCADPHCQRKVAHYFIWLQDQDSEVALLAKQFLSHTKAIAQRLVDDKVAYSLKDVDTVLKNGFHHIYDTQEIPDAIWSKKQ